MKKSILLNSAICMGLLSGFTGCTPKQDPADKNTTVTDTVKQSQKLNDEQDVMAVLFQQQSAEYRALCLQAYHFAQLRVDNSIHANKGKLPLAVITDLDETALDNGAQYGWEYKNNKTFVPKDWDEWCKMEKADAVPGSVDFFKYADAHKVDIYYVSNRDTSEVDATLDNMKKLGFPQLDKSHFLFKVKESSKEERRKEVAKTHNIILLLGDNLNDFASLFEEKSIADRKAAVDQSAKEWGEKFVVLPNAVYGDWENAMYEYKHGLSLDEKTKLRVSNLKSHE